VGERACREEKRNLLTPEEEIRRLRRGFGRRGG
jgi:hypothetical protein